MGYWRNSQYVDSRDLKLATTLAETETASTAAVEDGSRTQANVETECTDVVGTLTVDVEHSWDGATWDVAATQSITTVGTYRIVAGDLRPYVRVTATASATAGDTATFDTVARVI